MSTKPLVLVCGKNRVCAEGLKFIHESLEAHEVAYAYSVNDQASCVESIDAAKALGIPVFCVMSPSNLTDLYLKLKPALLISIQFSIILQKKLIEIAGDTLVNLHFSPLPLYRGMAPITLAILSGESFFGVTLHLIDSGIDTGSIIDQKKFCILGKSNHEVYSMCEQAGLDLIKDNIRKFGVADGHRGLRSDAYEQNDSIASYFSRDAVDYTKNQINFNGTASQIERHARAFTFPPSLYPLIIVDGQRYSVRTPPVIGDRCIQHKPGTILSRNPVVISSRDRALIFNDVREEN